MIASESWRGARRATRAAYAALGWVVLFFAFHVYWYAGGSFGSPGEVPSGPDSVVVWSFQALVLAAFPVAAWACLAIARDGARGRLALAAATIVWLGCVLLLLRGGAGIIDDLARTTGLLANGITGLSLEDTVGTTHPSAYTRWSGRAIDAYFLGGGIIFAVLAFSTRGTQARLRDRRG